MIIAVTGGIGSGKSRVSRLWSKSFHLPLLDVDQICRQLLQKKEPGWQALQKHFGDRFFSKQHQLDRKAFRRILFHDSCVRKEVNAILHPLAKARMLALCSQTRSDSILIEIPLLFEAGWNKNVDRIVLVYADTATRLSRVMHRDGVSEHEGLLTISSQDVLEEKAMKSDHVIENSGPWWNTALQVYHLGSLYSAIVG